MNKALKSIILITTCLIIFPLTTQAENIFDPALIISDQEMLNYKDMSLSEVQSFLNSQNSFLATYKTTSSYGKEKTAAEIIYDASVNNYDCDGITLSETPTEEERLAKCKKIGTVNPKFLLVLLQKEQSLISEKTPKQSQLDWATGYGCPDNWTCNPYYKGFGKQVNSAALQFRWYMLNPDKYNYKAGETYTFKNLHAADNNKKEVTVTIENTATAALYNYTPHVYNGNYNFWVLWNKYFPTEGYPDGSILKVGEDYWLIQYGQKRKFSSVSVLSSRYNPSRAISVNPSDLSPYEEGAPIKFHNYSIIMSPDGKLYLLVGEKKRLFSTSETFKKLGFNIAEIQNASWQDINSYKDGKEVTIASAYPTGALLQNKKTGGVYWVEEEAKAPLLDKIFLTTKFKGKTIIPVTEEELDLYQTLGPVKFDNGELLKDKSSSAVYLIEKETKRAFSTGTVFEELGYGWDNIITVSEKLIKLYPDGDLIQ